MKTDGSWSMTPAAAEIRDQAWVVTALEGTAGFVNVAYAWKLQRRQPRRNQRRVDQREPVIDVGEVIGVD